MARPLKQIDANQVYKLAAMFCTDDEIAGFFDAGETTLKRRFRKELDAGRAAGKMSIKRKQYTLAVDGGNVAMLIWLGKQYLGQRDKMDQTIRDETPSRAKPVEKLTDEELKAELEKQAAAAGVAGRVEPAPGAEEPA
jgi:hypothetical protein